MCEWLRVLRKVYPKKIIIIIHGSRETRPKAAEFSASAGTPPPSWIKAQMQLLSGGWVRGSRSKRNTCVYGLTAVFACRRGSGLSDRLPCTCSSV